MRQAMLSLAVSLPLALGACGVTNHGNVHAHGGPAGGDWEGHVASGAATKKAKKDTDGDGIPDRKDNCPKEAGTAENKGCAAKQDVEIVDGKIAIAGRRVLRVRQGRDRSALVPAARSDRRDLGQPRRDPEGLHRGPHRRHRRRRLQPRSLEPPRRRRGHVPHGQGDRGVALGLGGLWS